VGKLRLDKRVALRDNWTRTRIATHCAIATRRDEILPHCVVATRRDSTTLRGETRARIGREVGRLAIAKSAWNSRVETEGSGIDWWTSYYRGNYIYEPKAMGE